MRNRDWFLREDEDEFGETLHGRTEELYSVQDSLSAVASCLANSGLGIFGPGEGFHTLPSFAKVILTFDMWIGRLEIITGLIILSPSTYRT